MSSWWWIKAQIQTPSSETSRELDGAPVSAPTLSVTVTNFNYARFLEQNLTSIRTQTFEDFELIVVDNASTDDSMEIIARHAAEDERLRVVAHTENQGMFASLRESVDLCRGTYRIHVDADDYVLVPDAFATQVASMRAHPSMAFTYSQLVMVDTDDHVIHASRPYDHDTVLPGAVALEMVLAFTLNHSGMMFRLDAYRSTKGYPDRYAHVADMLLAGRLCAVGDVGYIDRQMYGFRKHGTNLHLRPELHVVRDEMIPVIDESFAGIGAHPGASAARRRATRRALVHLPTQYVFSGQPRVGWRLYVESAKLHPYDTIVQARTLSLLGRTVLGQRGYESLAARIRRRPPEHHGAAEATAG
jgi:glycosyltransferase involved in cell wall biosynthesis